MSSDRFQAVAGTATSYRGWTIYQAAGGSWCASDGRYASPAAAPPMAGAPTIAALQSRIDRFITRQAATPAR